MKYQPLASGILQFAVLLAVVMGVGATGAMANHEEAMALVREGEIRMQGDLEPAETIFRDVLILHPNDPIARAWAHLRLAEIYWSGGRWTDSAHEARRAWALVEATDELDIALGVWAGVQAAWASGRTGAYTEALRIAPQVLERFADVLPNDGRHLEAVARLNFLIAEGYVEEDQDNLGVMLYASRAIEAAASAMEHADCPPEAAHIAPWATLLEARALARAGLTTQALERLDICLATHLPTMEWDKHYRDLLFLHAVTHFAEHGRVAQARDLLGQALSEDRITRGIVAEALVCYGDALHEQGEPAQAREAWALAQERLVGAGYWWDQAAARLAAHGTEPAAQELTEPPATPGVEAIVQQLEEIDNMPVRLVTLERIEALVQDCREHPDYLEMVMDRLRQSPLQNNLGQGAKFEETLDELATNLPEHVYAIEKVECIRTDLARGKERDDLAWALEQCDAVLAHDDLSHAVRSRALETQAALLYIDYQDGDAEAALDAFRASMTDAFEREMRLMTFAENLGPTRIDVSEGLLIDIVAGTSHAVHRKIGLFNLCGLHWEQERPEDVLQTLDTMMQLAGDGPGDEFICQGHMLAARGFCKEYDNAELAGELRDRVIAAGLDCDLLRVLDEAELAECALEQTPIQQQEESVVASRLEVGQIIGR